MESQLLGIKTYHKITSVTNATITYQFVHVIWAATLLKEIKLKGKC